MRHPVLRILGSLAILGLLLYFENWISVFATVAVAKFSGQSTLWVK